MVQQLLNIGSRWTEAVKIVGLFIAVIGVITGFLWAIGRNEARDAARDFVGVTEFETLLMEQTSLIERGFDVASLDREDLRTRQSEIQTQIAEVEVRVASFEPPPLVAEMDTRRSMILTHACMQGELCAFQMRGRRTDFGANCDSPLIREYVTDGLGDLHDVDVLNGAIPQNIGTQWHMMTGSFTVPETAAPGPADFFVARTYMCPTLDGGMKSVNDDRPEYHLPFTIIAEGAQ